MENSDALKDMIEVKGRLSAPHPSHAVCRASKKGSAFKTLVSLADQAALARLRLETALQFGHPLGSQLKGLDCAELVTFFLAFTQSKAEQQSNGQTRSHLLQPLSEHSFVMEQADQQGHKNQVSSSSYEENIARVPAPLDLDDDSFEAFSTFPGSQA